MFAISLREIANMMCLSKESGLCKKVFLGASRHFMF